VYACYCFHNAFFGAYLTSRSCTRKLRIMAQVLLMQHRWIFAYEHMRRMPGRKVIPVVVSLSNSWSLCIWYQCIAILVQLYEDLASLVSFCRGGELFARDVDAVPQPYPRGIMSTPVGPLDVTVRRKPSFLGQLIYRIRSIRTSINPRSRRWKFSLPCLLFHPPRLFHPRLE
jgi:hypothetical protein